MSAELIITVHPAPTTTASQPLITATDAQRAEVERRIRAIDPDPEAVASAITDILYVDAASTPDDAIAAMTEAVFDYIAAWQVSRDSSWVVIKDTTYVVTGGTTYGDAPSDHWDAACFVSVHGLFDEPFPT